MSDGLTFRSAVSLVVGNRVLEAGDEAAIARAGSGGRAVNTKELQIGRVEPLARITPGHHVRAGVVLIDAEDGYLVPR